MTTDDCAAGILYGRLARHPIPVRPGVLPSACFPAEISADHLIKPNEHHYKLADAHGRYWSGVAGSWMVACSEIPQKWLQTANAGELRTTALGVSRDLTMLSKLHLVSPFGGEPCELHQAEQSDQVMIIPPAGTPLEALFTDAHIIAAIEKLVGAETWHHRSFGSRQTGNSARRDLLVSVDDDLGPQGFLYLNARNELLF